MKFKLKVSGIHCMGCVEKIKEYLYRVDGVNDVIIDLKTNFVFVDGNVSYENIISAINESGYKVEEI